MLFRITLFKELDSILFMVQTPLTSKAGGLGAYMAIHEVSHYVLHTWMFKFVEVRNTFDLAASNASLAVTKPSGIGALSSDSLPNSTAHSSITSPALNGPQGTPCHEAWEACF